MPLFKGLKHFFSSILSTSFRKRSYQTEALEPILTPSGLFDSGTDSLDFGGLDLDGNGARYVSMDSESGVHDALGSDSSYFGSVANSSGPTTNGPPESAIDIDDLLPKEIESLAHFESGYFIVGQQGKVQVDFLADGGGYEGELGIFSLDDMEVYAPGSAGFIQEAAERVISNSEEGHIVIADRTEGARFQSSLGEANRNKGEYLGPKSFTMRPGSLFAFMLSPNGRIADLVENPDLSAAKAPLFSLVTHVEGDGLPSGQFVDITGEGHSFALEDILIERGTDSDYNDMVFQVLGAKGKAQIIDEYISPESNWLDSEDGEQLIAYANQQAALDQTYYSLPEVSYNTDSQIEGKLVNGQFQDISSLATENSADRQITLEVDDLPIGTSSSEISEALPTPAPTSNDDDFVVSLIQNDELFSFGLSEGSQFDQLQNLWVSAVIDLTENLESPLLELTFDNVPNDLTGNTQILLAISLIWASNPELSYGQVTTILGRSIVGEQSSTLMFSNKRSLNLSRAMRLSRETQPESKKDDRVVLDQPNALGLQ
jgi:hypothetical protein